MNTALGAGTLVLNTGSENTAVGAAALLLNTVGGDNTAVGAASLLNNAASANTAIGSNALRSNTTGGTVGNTLGLDVGPNTAVGAFALAANTITSANTAVGYQALASFTTGLQGTDLGISTAVGFQALANVTGPAAGNDGVGYQALFNLTNGTANAAFGAQALFSSINGARNTAIGFGALFNNQTGDDNIAIGASAGFRTDGFNNILIGNGGVEGESNTIRIGSGLYDVYIAGIATVGLASGAQVLVNPATNQLGIAASSRRFKKDIESMDKLSEAILALKPVAFHYKNDKTNTPEFGLIAEDVAEVNPGLVVRDKNGDVYTVRYDAVNAMLLNEFLKEHKKVEKLESTVVTLAATVKEQAEEIRKVSAQLRVGGSTLQIVANDP